MWGSFEKTQRMVGNNNGEPKRTCEKKPLCVVVCSYQIQLQNHHLPNFNFANLRLIWRGYKKETPSRISGAVIKKTRKSLLLRWPKYFCIRSLEDERGEVTTDVKCIEERWRKINGNALTDIWLTIYIKFMCSCDHVQQGLHKRETKTHSFSVRHSLITKWNLTPTVVIALVGQTSTFKFRPYWIVWNRWDWHTCQPNSSMS